MAAAASAAGDSSGSAIRSVRPRSVRTRAAEATRTLSCEGEALVLGCASSDPGIRWCYWSVVKRPTANIS